MFLNNSNLYKNHSNDYIDGKKIGVFIRKGKNTSYIRHTESLILKSKTNYLLRQYISSNHQYLKKFNGDNYIVVNQSSRTRTYMRWHT